uniref:Uncharacterized protein n=1 Tax=Romanomermis culicivorax TaxID=13658 RepID=A0A915IX73_ROMCU
MGHLCLPFATERNGMRNEIDATLPNKREIFVPFGSAGDYHRSVSRKLYLPFLIESRKSNNYEEEKNRFMNFVETINRNLEHGMKAALEKKPE